MNSDPRPNLPHYRMPPSLELPSYRELDLAISEISPRHLSVLAWMTHGKSSLEIADLLGLGLKTVERDCSLIYRQLGTNNRLSAAKSYLWWLFHQQHEGEK